MLFSINVGSHITKLIQEMEICCVFLLHFNHIGCEISSSERANVFQLIILILSLLSVCARNLLTMTLIGIGTRTCIHGH